MTCSVCGAETSAGSTVCRSCDLIVGKARHPGANSGRYTPRARATGTTGADVSPIIATIWFIALLVATIWCGNRLYGQSSDAYHVGLQGGHVVGNLLFAALIAGVLRWLAKFHYVRTFLVTWTVLVPLTFFSVAVDNQRERSRGEHDALLALNNIATNKTPASSTSAASGAPSIDGGEKSPMQIALEQMTQNTAAFKQQEKTREQTRRDLHMELVLTPERLVSAEGIAQSRASLAQYRTLIDEHRAALLAFEDRNQATLTNMPAALEGFKSSRLNADQAFGRYFDVEIRYIDTANQVLDVAQRAVGRSSIDKTGVLRLPQPMLGQIQQLSQTVHAEVVEEDAAQKNLQVLNAQHREAMNRLLQQSQTANAQ
ncbi:hypothetical protein [Dyella sp. 2HG41-7]|uniref:hypothetical protein n=1 Tax=Dyella sp. 2HG41-7 TaxID=2883239 RepID=UPI001F294FF6|nr:hypothetical protein [Dyella sp. 2HG41-7]